MSRETMTDKELVDAFLEDAGFQKLVEDDLGKLVAPVKVDWPNNKICFYGERSGKELPIDAMLAELRGKTQ